MTDQNKALLDQRSEHTSRLEEFERNKRTRSRAYSSSEHSSVDSHYFKARVQGSNFMFSMDPTSYKI